MSERPPAKPRITIVGAGNLASALAVSLYGAGYKIDQIVSRQSSESSRRAQRLARDFGASVVSMAQARIGAKTKIVWFCVPDAAIATVAASLAVSSEWRGKIALHSSGALTSDELAVLRRRGAAVASVHPLMTFVRGSRPLLAGIPFAIEGGPRAVRAARAVVRDLHGKSFPIRKQQKPLYHAWGMFASPLLTALLASAEDVAVAAGVNRTTAKERMLPILTQTLANYERLGAPESFSGPIARGDVATIEKHLRVLRRVPQAREVYVALARSAFRNLPSKNRAALEKILKA